MIDRKAQRVECKGKKCDLLPGRERGGKKLKPLIYSIANFTSREKIFCGE